VTGEGIRASGFRIRASGFRLQDSGIGLQASRKKERIEETFPILSFCLVFACCLFLIPNPDS
jgi:hypothetical protein